MSRKKLPKSKKNSLKKKALILGNLTLDVNSVNGRTYTSVGGSAYFTSRTLSNFGLHTDVISPRGTDLPGNSLHGINLIPVQPVSSHTLSFHNIYESNKPRKQTVGFIEFSDLPSDTALNPELLQNADILIAAPVINNISSVLLKSLTRLSSRALKVLLPQGFFRKTVGERIVPTGLTVDEGLFGGFDIIVVSDRDHPLIDRFALRWGIGRTMVIVTRADKPATLVHKGRKTVFPAVKSEKIVDETGAGDIFAASLAYSYLFSRDVSRSMVFAHVSAALSLPLLPYKLKYSPADVYDYAARKGIVLKP